MRVCVIARSQRQGREGADLCHDEHPRMQGRGSPSDQHKRPHQHPNNNRGVIATGAIRHASFLSAPGVCHMRTSGHWAGTLVSGGGVDERRDVGRGRRPAGGSRRAASLARWSGAGRRHGVVCADHGRGDQPRARRDPAKHGTPTGSSPARFCDLPITAGRRRRPTASQRSDRRRPVTRLVGCPSGAGRPRGGATAGRRSAPGPTLRARSGPPSASSARPRSRRRW